MALGPSLFAFTPPASQARRQIGEGEAGASIASLQAQVKTDLDVNSHSNRVAVFRGRLEPPGADGAYRALVQAHPQRGDEDNVLYSSGVVDDDVHAQRALETGPPGRLSELRFELI